ncbi:leader peptidase (prepilin peptidase)/N-methyltransferase [Jatrophihabitans sp. GAS493]|uniref:prepilin peptidase n=1 Tax=Jatrophihabitans sp. GAS493 TaxID=1907575 RepID=UPI000BBF9334|nr:A24 family peptidase [Jatrophihabitans sp. GAS493]SOD72885.1 leader peptidase (prepilin peptidase)/N-methyltransferase [Jatrophihabitans sp. GAS493]
MSSTVTASIAAAAAAAITAPYLAGLTITAPDRRNATWWHPTRASRPRTTATAAGAIALAAIGAIATRWTAAWPAYLVLALTGAVLIVVDLEHHRLPDRIMRIAAAAGFAGFFVAAAVTGNWARLGRVALAAGFVAAVFYGLALLSPRSIGLGDVKLAGLLAGYLAWFGWLTVIGGLATGFVAAGITGIVLLITRHANRNTHIPLGPFLITAAVVIATLHP